MNPPKARAKEPALYDLMELWTNSLNPQKKDRKKLLEEARKILEEAAKVAEQKINQETSDLGRTVFL